MAKWRCSCPDAFFSVVLIFIIGSLNLVSVEMRASDSAWQARQHRLGNIMVQNSRVSSLLSSLGSHEFSISEAQLRRGTTYIGSNHRLRAALREGMSGRRPLKIGVVGGSISYGHGASKRGVTDWASLVGAWAAKALGNSTLRNGCIPGTPSAYMAVCLEMGMENDVDIAFVEYVLNDGRVREIDNERSREYERLVRRILSLPNRPAVIMMQTCNHGSTYPLGDREWTPFHDGIEDVYGAIAQYYDAQWLSFRAATYRPANIINDSKLSYMNVMGGALQDFIHPSDVGHRIMADLAVWLMQQTALDLLIRPWGADEEELLSEGLPPPMYPGNGVPNSTTCVHFEALNQLITAWDGFEFVEEGPKKKKGFVGLRPGAFVTFLINTALVGGGGPDTHPVLVQLGHLKSYEHMGVGVARCVSGCQCEDKIMDAHHSVPASQTYLASLMVSQHTNCVITVTIANETSSREHKFKIVALMISVVAGSGGHHGFQNEVEFTGALENQD